MKIDAVDRDILSVLQEEASISNLDLSKRVGLSPSACLMRTRKMREEGVIRGYSTLVDEKAVGLTLLAFTFVNLSPHNRTTASTFVEAVRAMDPVLECHNITGAWDYLLKVVTADMAAYRDFLMDELLSIRGVQRVETNIILQTEKQTRRLPLP